MMKRYLNSFKFLVLIIVLFFLPYKAVFSITKSPTKDLDSTIAIGSVSKSGLFSNFTKNFKPQVGFTLSPVVPLGIQGKLLATSFASTKVFADALLNFKFMKLPNRMLSSFGFSLRSTMSFGFSHLSQKADLSDEAIPAENKNITASYNMLPFLLGLKIQYSNVLLRKFGVSPYFILQTGLSYLSMSASNGDDSIQDSSLAASFSTALGVLYHHPSLPYTDFLLELNYFLPFQKGVESSKTDASTGYYLLISFGALYRFDWKNVQARKKQESADTAKGL